MSHGEVGSDRSAVYEFAGFRLDVAERLLICDGRPLQITPRAFDLLVYLVEHRGRLLHKSTLLAEVWRGTIVEEANLAFQVSTLRKTLNGRGGEDLIQTVAGKGYRFVAPVTLITEAPSMAAPAPPELPAPTLVATAVAVLLLATAGVVLLWLNPPGEAVRYEARPGWRW